MVAVIASCTSSACAAEGLEIDLDGIADTFNEWVADREAFGGISAIDAQRVRQLYDELAKRLSSTNIYELADVGNVAADALAVLKQFEETAPYAIWLQTHLDYFQVAEELKKSPRTPLTEAEQKAWTTRLAKRPAPTKADVYAARLKPIFMSAGVPASLVWIAEVESSFEPTARSPAGAVGMFQLMPATAKRLGLSLSPRDERLDPERSARAAARYLAYLKRRFGDWRLALAAYNAGEGRVAQLLEHTRTRSYAAIASRLPAETQMYVPKVEATLRRREAVTLASLANPP